MRKSILTLGIAAVLTGVLATCSMTYAADDELAQIQESGKLKVGVEGTYPPYTYHDDNGELTGFDVEVAKAIADKLGVEADFTESDWDSLLAGIDSGRLDTVINAVSITPEREEKYDFAGPYFYITQQISDRVMHVILFFLGNSKVINCLCSLVFSLSDKIRVTVLTP